MDSPRLVAAKALIRCDQGGYSQLVMDAALKTSGLTGRDASLATALFYGALERKNTLDHCIARYTKKPPDAQVRAVLHIAFFSLLYLDRVAEHAVVDEAVKSTRALRRTSAASMVNAVLRTFLRDGCKIPPITGDAAEQLTINCSCSKDVANRLIDWMGNGKAREILERSMGRPPVFLRVNTLKTSRTALVDILEEQGIKADAVEDFPDSLAVTGDAAHAKAFKDGLFHIQDLSSQKTAMLMEAKPGSRLLDVCAAPGSKSFVLAQEMKNAGSILCADISEGRLRLIEEGACRLGIDIIKACQNDATRYRADWGLFDGVLCDVPCSGLGALRRKPELKYRTAAEIDGFAKIGYDILSTSAHYCKPGGRIIFSTCTLNPDENEGVLQLFLQNHSDFVPDLFSGDRYFHTNLPGEKGADGFFLSRIRRKL
jgi:16S rRNA (cytosine967-C5)-methyltransferase